jgi:hypothetical protein
MAGRGLRPASFNQTCCNSGKINPGAVSDLSANLAKKWLIRSAVCQNRFL